MNNKIIGANIRKARKERGMTQKELGAAILRTESSVAKYEQALVDIPNNVLSSIAVALGVEWTALVLPAEAIIDPDDKEVLNILLPKMSELDPLTDAETALKILLKSIGYDLIKTRGEYFLTFESGGAEISINDLNELLICAQNGLKIAAKTLELKLLREAFGQSHQATTAAESTPYAPEGKDTDSPDVPPEGE